MNNVYMTSDWHIGHKGISTNFRTDFRSDEEHDHIILSTAAATVTKNDILYVLGDMTWTQEGLRKIKEADIKARVILIAGNHDKLRAREYLQVVDDVKGAKAYKGWWLTHIPIIPTELRGRKNVHGHTHAGGPNQLQNIEGWQNYYSAILEENNYMPVHVKEIAAKLQEQDQLMRNKC